MTSATDPHADLPVVTAGAALTDATVAVIAIHGRGASPLDILMLESRLAHRDVAWLAPTAAGRRWYPHRFIAEIAANEPDLGSALRRIETLVDEILEAGPLALTNLYHTYNPKDGTLDTNANLGNILHELTSNPGDVVCALISGVDKKGDLCKLVDNLLPRNAPFASGSWTGKPYDPTLSGLVEVDR